MRHFFTYTFWGRFFLLLIFLIAGRSIAYAQTYNNEWIDYSKTYYKFKIAATGAYRILPSALQSAGLNSVPSGQFQLWHNGKEVPLYISVDAATSINGNGAYIEFYGERNDGQLDKGLYRVPEDQLNDNYSLETDSAAYYLTVNTAGNNLRQNIISNQSSNVTTNTPDPYFMYSDQVSIKEQLNKGRASTKYGSASSYVYSPTYDVGEGWTTNDIGSDGNGRDFSFSNLKLYQGNVNAVVQSNVSGNSGLGTNRTIKLKLNNTILDSKSINDLYGGTLYATVSAASITGNNATINLSASNSTANTDDRFVASSLIFTYPRLFDFRDNNNSLSSSFLFTVMPKVEGNYLSITGFNSGNTPAIMYDVNNNERYMSNETSGTYNFYLKSVSSNRKLYIYSTQSNIINQLPANALVKKNFIDYKNTNQGDFIIITNKYLRTGADAVEQYRAYRASAAGGSHNAKIYDIEQLEDQFMFGVKRHPNSIRNFLSYARAQFSTPIKYILLIGHGVTYDRFYGSSNDPNQSAAADLINLVPTFGYPASDILLSSSNLVTIPTTPIGRLSVSNQDDLLTYLSKVKEYESVGTSTIADNKWRKNLVSIAGGFDQGQSDLFISYLDAYESYLTQPYFGALPYDFNKYTSNSTTQLSDQRLRDLFTEGIGLINYFGHAASTTLDYNLDAPENYKNAGKYPVFYTSGCDIGDFFSYGTGKGVPEKYVFASESGSIAFFCQSYLGLTTYLHNYNLPFFRYLSKDGYGQPLGVVQQYAAQQTILNNYPYGKDSIATDAQAACNILLGDPAIGLSPNAKPDYAIESSGVYVTPSFISVSNTTYQVKAIIYNLGKATTDSVYLKVQQISPNGSIQLVFDKNIAPIYNKDSVSFNVPIVGSRDKGQCYLNFTIDPDNQIDEVTKINNTLKKSVFIYDNGLTPVYPYDYSIVRNSTVVLRASTANVLAPLARYVMQIDTTTFFNSPLKSQQTVSSTGGLVEFTPNMSWVDNRVYYWRVAAIPVSGKDTSWNGRSFMYLSTAGTSNGYNQSHFYQHTQSTFDQMKIDSTSRKWTFDLGGKELLVYHAAYPAGASNTAAYRIVLDGTQTTEFFCQYYKLIFNVFEKTTLKPYYNSANPTTTPISGGTTDVYPGSNGTTTGACVNVFWTFGQLTGDDVATNFEFGVWDADSRNKVRDFMNWIPEGSSVVVRQFFDLNQGAGTGTNNGAAYWKADRTTNGNNNTLYDKLLNAGFTNIDNFTNDNEAQPWVFVYNKDLNNPLFPPMVKYATTSSEAIALTTALPTQGGQGTVTSPKFGPAAKWHTVLWDGAPSKQSNGASESGGDQFSVDVIGIDNNGGETVLHSMPITEKSWDASAYSPLQYPYLKLRMHNMDTVNYTPYQMDYWRILFDAVPEGALVPNLYFHSTADTIDRGQTYNMGIGFKNISDVPFAQPIKVHYSILDRNNISHDLSIPDLKALASGEIANIEISVPGQPATAGGFSTKDIPGMNNQYLDVNPNNDQPEQTHDNNFMYKSLYVNSDESNQNLDVTFDGVHILNNDIIIPTPHITIRLKDDSRFFLLKDTSAITVTLQYPDQSYKKFTYKNDTLLFTGAKDSLNNIAVSDFTPFLNQDGTYKLIVQGKNPSSDNSEPIQYAVGFQVISKPMISDVFNYPNPFTTSTAFVFTLTGSHLPQNIRIQILTVTGKIVKDITKEELGTLHIGRNITDYKWDGKDNYGQKLANGVYLYRIITSEDGKALDKYNITENSKSINTGQYFKAGYGKMYLMR